MGIAISSDASLVVKSMADSANGPKETARILSSAILPASDISWNREIIHAATTDVLNKMLMKLRNSPLHRMRYDKLTNMFATAFSNPYALIPEWDEWKQMEDAYMPDRRFPQEAIAQTITFSTARCVPDPGALATLDAGSIETMAADSPNAGPLRTFGSLPRTASADVSPNEHLALPASGLSATAFKKAVKRCLWSLGRKYPPMPLVREQLKAPESFGKLGPPPKSAC